jgi:hypothetical protein
LPTKRTAASHKWDDWQNLWIIAEVGAKASTFEWVMSAETNHGKAVIRDKQIFDRLKEEESFLVTGLFFTDGIYLSRVLRRLNSEWDFALGEATPDDDGNDKGLFDDWETDSE